MEIRVVSRVLASTVALTALFLVPICAHPQSAGSAANPNPISTGAEPVRAAPPSSEPALPLSLADLSPPGSDPREPASPPPAPPEPPSAGPFGRDHPNVPWAGEEHWPPLSRIGIGADLSPLGLGVKTAVLLTEAIDGRLTANYLYFQSGRFEVDGFNADIRLKLGSAAAALDWYPFKSIWRVSVGTLFLNRNEISANSRIIAGTSFTLDGTKFYSASPNASSTASPLIGTGVLNLHPAQPVLTLTGGFGRYIPRSRHRHWTFPTEFGVAFMGTPKLNVTTAGTVCLDQEDAECANLSNTSDPTVTQFNQSLQGALAKWRRSLSSFQIYPILSYGVVYSFQRPHAHTSLQ